MSATNPRPMIHKYLHFAHHPLTTHLHSTFTATLLTFFVARKLISKLFDNAFGLFVADTSRWSPPATLWTISVTLQVCNQYSLIAQSAHLSHLKQHSPDNDQVTILGANIIAHLKVKDPFTEPSICVTPFQVRNTTHTWNRINPITIKLQFQVLI